MILTIDHKDYELALTTRSALQLEERLKKNPINVLLKIKTMEELPSLNDTMIIFHAMLQKYHHGISMDAAMDLFDKYMAEGGNVIQLIEVIVKVFEESGLIRFEEDGKNFQ